MSSSTDSITKAFSKLFNTDPEEKFQQVVEQQKQTAPYVFSKSGIPFNALKQSEFWYDRKGKVHMITKMHPLHARRAASKLIQAYPTVSTIDSPLYKALQERFNTV